MTDYNFLDPYKYNDLYEESTGIWFNDTEEEYETMLKDYFNNPDFTYLGHYDMIQDIFYDLNDLGFTDEQITRFTHNRYGTVLMIIQYIDQYEVFFGTH